MSLVDIFASRCARGGPGATAVYRRMLQGGQMGTQDGRWRVQGVYMGSVQGRVHGWVYLGWAYLGCTDYPGPVLTHLALY